MRLLFLHPYVCYFFQLGYSHFILLHSIPALLAYPCFGITSPLLFVDLSFSEVFWKVLNFHEISVIFLQQPIYIFVFPLNFEFFDSKDSYHCIISILQCLKYEVK